ncbi:BREX-1 system phosphatase PglZ type A [Paenibacillus sp. WQ 127069]|uniref:BREX-1 system phosphatase PglZ type A n=1 Tax=Paenibacillus baimaensis TaxID=2982185 RepID=A0ABT2UQB0_9BACL|nr:BREX-1 system phosphatase PglZ type A [Paenibacillus sp. WQ 127069]MCU6796829.1 BREX-1 system phosphatase PglZ type A [Paenibacillus sp. WQ 127069]
MPELNLKQITDKLNAEFTGGTRKLVFWYDEKAEFVDDVNTLKLTNAKVYHLEPDNQFYTKYFMERTDRTTNYLIYAPFPKPPVRDNHLADTIKYSKEFFADRASLLTLDLGIDEKYKPVIQKYIKFFGAKDRTQRFYDLEIENFTRDTIEIALMSALCKTRTASFEEVVRVVLTDDGMENNKILADFEKYDLLQAFWRLCEEQFGYTDVNPTLEKLVVTLFVTYTERYMDAELPKSWKSFASYKSGNIIAFLDNLMNSMLYRDRYNELSEYVAAGLNAAVALEAFGTESLLRCDTFALIDRMIINWIMERLLAEDTGAKLNGMTIQLICQERSKMHFGEIYKMQYQLLEHAYYLIMEGSYNCPDDLTGLVNQYRESDYLIDTHYRYFYYCFDKLKDTVAFERLRDLIENIYTHEYLSKITTKWNAAFIQEEAMTVLPLQRNFYSRYIRNRKERVVVIISDAMRYETGLTLWGRLQDDEKCTAKLEAMLSVLPSYTRLGMAALLPHRNLEMTDDYRILVDGATCEDLKQRESVLQGYNPNSRCIQFDDIKSMKRDAIRQVFAGMDIIYIYHNQIDARGDKPNSENEVFFACEEAVNEIHDLIKQLTDHVSATHYIVTADHGFIYKRDRLQESDKIANVSEKGSFVNRRFIVSEQALQGDGIGSVSMSRMLGNDDSKVVSFPISSNVFKVAGGGQNYVHGGSSPQEMIVPVLDIKTEKGHKDTRTVQITLVSMVQKISNLITTLDFIQNEPISDVVKGTSYKIFFITDENEKISNENIYVADKKDIEPQKRIFRLRFNFRNRQYDKSKRYYLVAYDEKNDVEVLRHDVLMDIAFANDFGFNV